VKLRERLGPDHSIMHDDLAPKLKCSKCGGKKVGLILSPPTGPSGHAMQRGYITAFGEFGGK
jgi:hypothetical protein